MSHIVYWVVLGGSLTLGTYLEGGKLQTLFHLNTAIMIAVPTLFYCVYRYGFDGIGGFIGRVFRGKTERNDTRNMRSICRLATTLGYMAALSGCVHIAANGANNWQAGMAVVLTAVFYGLLPQLFFFPFLHGKQTSHAKSSNQNTTNSDGKSNVLRIAN